MERIPAELSRLMKLRALDLSGVRLSCLWYISTLDVSGDRLKLEKPNLRSLIGDLGELRELYLDGSMCLQREGSGATHCLLQCRNLRC